MSTRRSLDGRAVVVFDSAAELRRWLETHHARETELWIGFWKKDTGRACATYSEALDEALCFGWIDGIRRSVDGECYTNRFTPRKARSIWSTINTNRMRALIAAGRARPAGLAAFEAREAGRSGIYSHEQERPGLSAADTRTLRSNARAWAGWQAMPPGYRRQASWWVAAAKQAATRARRLATLVACSARGEKIPPLQRADDRRAPKRSATKPARRPRTTR